MNRRTFLAAGLLSLSTTRLWSAVQSQQWDQAVAVLEEATHSKQVDAAVLHVVHQGAAFTQHFGSATSGDAMFLLGSISKPINMTALMALFDEGKFQLDDHVQKYLPGFTGEGREQVTIRNLLTHVSGLPDQLPNNNEIRREQAPLTRFVEEAIKSPLGFSPGTKYQYSSMGILLAASIAEILGGTSILTLVEKNVFKPLGMQHSAQGLGSFQLTDFVRCQMEGAAPESGSGDPTAKNWDWNSLYWRKLGAPWGGTHASAPDIGRFLAEFLHRKGQAVRPETAELMTRNHNPPGLTSRGLGFVAGLGAGSPGCSDQTFGHTGSTGTLCWADPAKDTICVVLTSLPGRAVSPHPRELAARSVANDLHRQSK